MNLKPHTSNVRILSFCFLFLIHSKANAQTASWQNEQLNTAANALYMLPQERAMIYELNRLRSDPPRYARMFVEKEMREAKEFLQTAGKGGSSYSLRISFRDNKPDKTDTIYHYVNEENFRALQTLYDTLLQLKPLQLLQPDRGIYTACKKHAADQVPTGTINHQGTNGSWPWERIKADSPGMADGNENLACGTSVARAVVLQLLIDAGISNYGHRYNMLQPQWTHAACYMVKENIGGCRWWIQNFAVATKKKGLKADRQ